MKQTDDPTKNSKRTEAHRRVTREVQTQLTQTNMMVPQGEVKPSTLNTETQNMERRGHDNMQTINT